MSKQTEIWALIIKNAPALSKTRLKPVLNEVGREQLTNAMLQHVISVAVASPLIRRVAVVSPEKHQLSEGVRWIRDSALGMNSAVSEGVAQARRLHAGKIVVLPADLPCLREQDLAELLTAVLDGDVVFAPDKLEHGTNALVLGESIEFSTQFGEFSFSRHLEMAKKLALRVRVVKSDSLGFDIDDPEDWQHYCSIQRAERNLAAM